MLESRARAGMVAAAEVWPAEVGSAVAETQAPAEVAGERAAAEMRGPAEVQALAEAQALAEMRVRAAAPTRARQVVWRQPSTVIAICCARRTSRSLTRRHNAH